MLILAFDTAVAACSVAVWRDGVALATARHLMERGQAEHLVPLIASVMTEANVTYDSIDRIAVTVGPGSFTGVRVGLATARGLALAHKIPVVGLTTGEVLAADGTARIGDAGTVVSLLDSKRGDLYVECFNPDGTAISDAVTLPVTEVSAWLTARELTAPFLCVGDGVRAFETQEPDARYRLRVDIVFPDPAVLARLAAARTIPATNPVPLYVRPPDVTMPAS